MTPLCSVLIKWLPFSTVGFLSSTFYFLCLHLVSVTPFYFLRVLIVHASKLRETSEFGQCVASYRIFVKKKKIRAATLDLIKGTPEKGKLCPPEVSQDVLQVSPTWSLRRREGFSESISWLGWFSPGMNSWLVWAFKVDIEERGKAVKPCPSPTYLPMLNTWHLLSTVCMPSFCKRTPTGDTTGYSQWPIQLELFFPL